MNTHWWLTETRENRGQSAKVIYQPEILNHHLVASPILPPLRRIRCQNWYLLVGGQDEHDRRAHTGGRHLQKVRPVRRLQAPERRRLYAAVDAEIDAAIEVSFPPVIFLSPLAALQSQSQVVGRHCNHALPLMPVDSVQKSARAANEKNRAASVTLNADVRRSKARLLEEVVKLQKVAAKKVKVKGLLPEEKVLRADLVAALPHRIQAIPDSHDGGATATHQDASWNARTGIKLDDYLGLHFS